jgi:hypothetical protein
MEGWIKLHRELLDKPIWQSSKLEQRVILITILLLANHAEKEWIFEGKKYCCKPGQFITSLKSLSEKSGASIRSVRTALENFEKIYGFLTNKSTNKNRLITVVNWELYQSRTEEPTSELTSNRQATDKQPTTNKNDKEYKEYKNIASRGISGNCEDYLKTYNTFHIQEIMSYLGKGLEEELIIEIIRDAAKTADKSPVNLCKSILARCTDDGINTLSKYIESSKKFKLNSKGGNKIESTKPDDKQVIDYGDGLLSFQRRYPELLRKNTNDEDDMCEVSGKHYDF